MNLNIKHIKITILSVAAFFICCSMSKCNLPGPETEVHGVITDGVTGKPIGNLPMVISEFSNDPHYFNTNADGSYDIKFTPEKVFNYGLAIQNSVADNYIFYAPQQITQGINNTINYVVYPAINVTVHLVNHSSYGQNTFNLITNDTLSTQLVTGGFLSLNKVTIDSTFKYQLGHYTHVGFKSSFLTNGGPDAKNFSQNFILGNKDTLINISNP